MEKSIFEFKNILHNYCRGKYHFIASSLGEARVMAQSFQKTHNTRTNFNYTLDLDFERVKIIPIMDGFLNIR